MDSSVSLSVSASTSFTVTSISLSAAESVLPAPSTPSVSESLTDQPSSVPAVRAEVAAAPVKLSAQSLVPMLKSDTSVPVDTKVSSSAVGSCEAMEHTSVPAAITPSRKDGVPTTMAVLEPSEPASST